MFTRPACAGRARATGAPWPAWPTGPADVAPRHRRPVRPRLVREASRLAAPSSPGPALGPPADVVRHRSRLPSFLEPARGVRLPAAPSADRRRRCGGPRRVASFAAEQRGARRRGHQDGPRTARRRCAPSRRRSDRRHGDGAARHRAVAGRPTSGTRSTSAAGLGGPRRRAPPGRVVPGLPRVGDRHPAAHRAVRRRRPGRAPGRPTPMPCRRCSTTRPRRAGRSRTRTPATMPLDVAVDRFYTTDVFMHTWDLARATGQDDTLDPTLCGRAARGHGADRRAAALVGPVRPAGAGGRRRPGAGPAGGASSAATRPGGPDLRRSGPRRPGAASG